MLPDFPSVKRKLGKRLHWFLRARIHHHAPLLGELHRSVAHEGHDSSMRPIGAEAADPPREYEAHEKVSAVRNEVLRRGEMEEVLRAYDEIAEDFAEKQSALLFDRVSEAADRAGNVVSGGGSMSRKTFLEVLSRIQTDFDPDTGEVKAPTLVMSPKMAEVFAANIEEWEQDPEFVAELKRIKTKKWVEWRDRESRRRLVD